MNEIVVASPQESFRNKSALVFVLGGAMIVLLFVAMYDGLAYMVSRWEGTEEYSHGYILPMVALYLAWMKLDPTDLALGNRQGWPGVVMIVLGCLLGILGEMSAIFEVIQYGFILSLFGVVTVTLGYRSFIRMLAPLMILFFMVPFPNFIYRTLSAQLQLWSSALGVEFIRLFDIPVFLEGNVIDLGAMKLQVVEACSGLRYLFPLLSLSYICAYLYQAPLWQRVVVFVSAMPITLVMNSLRIGAIGVTVEFWGPEMAEGFLHDFEGWIMFMLSLAVLIGEIYLLSRLLRPKAALMERFQLDQPASWHQVAEHIEKLKMSKPIWVSGLVVVIFLALMKSVPNRAEEMPQRTNFAEFPLQVGEWTGKKRAIDVEFLQQLNFTDYILADFTSDRSDKLNFYVAYYDSQRKGRSVHSPRTCIPGGGWEMKAFEEVEFDHLLPSGKPLRANKVMIQRGEERSLVYYWFDQRGRNITNEYAVKWFIFQDALMQSRTDGALVRLVIPLQKEHGNAAEAAAKTSAEQFLRDMLPHLPDYVPR